MDQPTRENETEEFVGQIHRLLQSGEEKQTYEAVSYTHLTLPTKA